MITTLRRTLLLGTALVLTIMVPAVMGAGSASALPPGGASPNTPGTSSVLNASSYQAGDKISFKVRGFPAGETINVKIDDGQECGKAAVHGACVVYKQRISSGTTIGSFRLPKDLKAGTHWLRFLASEEIQGGGGGTKGYSNRSPEFAIKATSKKSSTTTGSSNTGSSNNSTSNSQGSTTTSPTTGTSTSASPTPSTSETPSAKPSKKAKKKDKKEKKKNAEESSAPEETATTTGAGGMVTPEPVTAIVTGAGLSVAQALGVGGGAVGLAAVVGGLTAWWRRGGQ